MEAYPGLPGLTCYELPESGSAKRPLLQFLVQRHKRPGREQGEVNVKRFQTQGRTSQN